MDSDDTSAHTPGPWSFKLKDGCDMARAAWVVVGTRPKAYGQRHHQSKMAAKKSTGENQWVGMAFGPQSPCGPAEGQSVTAEGFYEGRANAALMALAPRMIDALAAVHDDRYNAHRAQCDKTKCDCPRDELGETVFGILADYWIELKR